MKTYNVNISSSDKIYMVLMKLGQSSEKQIRVTDKIILLFTSLENIANFTAA